MRRCGLSRSQLWRMARNGTFPRPLHVGRSARWASTAVDRWIADVVTADSKGGAP
ncbi:AlpA family phage regulatory protein [Lysobacter sp. TY2-98]|nr:AlpA family phage regulatory protein [Lysobacter sp. TY2-98]